MEKAKCAVESNGIAIVGLLDAWHPGDGSSMELVPRSPEVACLKDVQTKAAAPSGTDGDPEKNSRGLHARNLILQAPSSCKTTFQTV